MTDGADIDLEGGLGNNTTGSSMHGASAAAAAAGLPLVDGSPRNLCQQGLENPVYGEQPIAIVRGSVYRRESNVSIASVASVAEPTQAYVEPMYEAPADGITGVAAQQPIYSEASGLADVLTGQEETYAATYELAANTSNM